MWGFAWSRGEMLKAKALILPGLAMMAQLVLAGTSLAGQKYYLVRYRDINKVTTVKIMTRSEYDGLAKRLSVEKLVYNEAHRIAEEKWNAAGLPGRYPGKTLPLREIKRLGVATSLDKAKKMLANLQKRGSTGSAKKKANPKQTAAEKKKEEEKQALLAWAQNYFIDASNALVNEKQQGLGYAQTKVKAPPLPQKKASTVKKTELNDPKSNTLGTRSKSLTATKGKKLGG